MKKLLIYPPVDSHEVLCDLLSRVAWHFEHMEDIATVVALSDHVAIPHDLTVPEGFDPAVQKVLDGYIGKVSFRRNVTPSCLSGYDVILKHVEGREDVDKEVINSGAKVYRVDSTRVRQEGSFYIQCAFDAIEDKSRYIDESREKFQQLVSRCGRARKAWVLATGPSIDGYEQEDFSDSLTIVCNSVVLNDRIMEKTRPVAVVFADPIFHFGVSGYAGRFREILAGRLSSTPLTVIVPLKYYPLLISKMPEYRDRIIGVPFERMDDFNLDLNLDFRVMTTANILTLLLLPLAATLAREVHVMGCDGRPLEEDSYFWGHSKSVQINDKMANIQQVHPGFFDIDYNEYYFEHCHTLDRFITHAERQGIRFCHHGTSHIPTLRERTPARLALDTRTALSEIESSYGGKADLCLVIEPDGIGITGHYVKWHRNLIEVLHNKFPCVELLCNVQQDPELYNCRSHPVFQRHSWSISRGAFSYGADFAESESFQIFVRNLADGIRLARPQTDKTNVTLFVYYGSVQILEVVKKVRQMLAPEGISVTASVCIFHESVIMASTQTAPRFPPQAGKILMSCVAQADVFRITSVTKRLSRLILDKYGVHTEVFPNPVPNKSDSESLKVLDLLSTKQDPATQCHKILFPTNPREEKGAEIINGFIRFLIERGIPDNWQFFFRGDNRDFEDLPEGITFLGEGIDEDAYWKNLRSSSVSVIPYPPPHFKYRTSGILVDALVSGTPCVVMDDTWLSDTISDTGAGFSIASGDPITIFSAIKVIIDNHGYFRWRMVAPIGSYIESNSWNNAANSAIGKHHQHQSGMSNIAGG